MASKFSIFDESRGNPRRAFDEHAIAIGLSTKLADIGFVADSNIHLDAAGANLLAMLQKGQRVRKPAFHFAGPFRFKPDVVGKLRDTEPFLFGSR